MKKRVVVTGLGIISPVGNDLLTFWKALKEGKSGVELISTFDASNFDSRIAGEVKNFDPTLYGFEVKEFRRKAKFVQYALTSAKQALDQSGLDLEKINRDRAGVLIGSGIGDLMIIEVEHKVYLDKGPNRMSPFLIPTLIVNAASGHIGINFGLKGPNSAVATACASGSHAIGDAFKIIQRGDADIMVTGGSESCLVPTALGGFCALKALSKRNDDPHAASRPFEQDRDGFIMAEGCGIVVLESLEHAQKRNAKILAEIAGYGLTCDAYHITAPEPTGDGAGRAMKMSMADAGLNPEDIQYVNAHGTSTKLNDKIETLSMKSAFGAHAKKLMISSTKSMTGHSLGAAGGVEFVACCMTIQEGVVHPTINYRNPDPECDLDYVPNTARRVEVKACMSNSLGFGGHNASLVLKKFKD